MRENLRKPLDTKAVSQHPTKTYLSSIKAIYVTERLNEVFGVGSWTTKVSEIDKGDKGMVVVKVTLEIPEYNVYYESYGGNDNGGEGSKNFDLGDAYKGATTDAITKIGSFLEIGIDVFKGKASSPAGNNNNSEDKRPWLTEKQFTQALARIEKGEDGVYEKIDKAFRMKKEYRAKLKSNLKAA